MGLLPITSTSLEFLLQNLDMASSVCVLVLAAAPT